MNGLRNAASFDASLAPGTLATLFGERLSQGEQVATRFPLPSRMNAVTVHVNGQAAPLVYVGPGQINFLLPHTLAPGAASVVVSNAGAESTAAALTLALAPGIFTISQTGDGQGAILIAGTGLIARATRDAFSQPARRGDVVEIYATGLGPVTNPPAPGAPAPSSPLSRLTGTVLVEIGGAPAATLYQGLAPGLAGVYQVNATVPNQSAQGIAVPVSLRLPDRGLRSNTVTMAVLE